ncbi:MAG TPA: RNA-binding protein [Bryobacteraceae bacterium]|nr:RNA-binding protein [Bryobacteraceae bacterium]
MTLYLSNLPFDATESDLRDMFRSHGFMPTRQIRMPIHGNGQRRGFAFVELSDDVCQEAIGKLNGCLFMGRKINVQESRRSGGREGS